MQSMLKSLSLFLLLTILVGGCKTSILEDEGGNTIDQNVRIRIYPYWNNYFFSTDSIYLAGGSFLQIDEISVLHANFTFVNEGDTLDPGGLVNWKTGEGNELFVGNLPAGSYSGHYFYKVGLDSIQDALPPQAYPGNSPLATDNLYRGPLLGGYNYVVIKGNIVNPANPLVGPSIPMQWWIATQPLVSTLDEAKSFNVVPGRYVTVDVKFDIAKLFKGIFPLQTPIITSNPQDQNDYDQAVTLQQNFLDSYKIQF